MLNPQRSHPKVKRKVGDGVRVRSPVSPLAKTSRRIRHTVIITSHEIGGRSPGRRLHARFSRYLADPAKEPWGRSLASQVAYQDGGVAPETEVSVAAPSAASDLFIRAAPFWVNIFFHQIGRFFIHNLVHVLLLTLPDSMSNRAPASLLWGQSSTKFRPRSSSSSGLRAAWSLAIAIMRALCRSSRCWVTSSIV